METDSTLRVSMAFQELDATDAGRNIGGFAITFDMPAGNWALAGHNGDISRNLL